MASDSPSTKTPPAFTRADARSLWILLILAFTLATGAPARAGNVTQVAIGATSLCAGFGMAVFATNTLKSRLALALGTCLGVGFSALMPFAAMDEALVADVLPMVAAPMGLLVVSSTVSLLMDDWNRSARARLVAATANGAAFGLGMWMLGGMLLSDGTQAIDVWHPLTISAALASAALAGAAGFAAGTTDQRAVFIGTVPLMGFLAGQVGVLTYTLVQAARAERSNPAVLGAFIAGGLALGSVVGLILAAASPPAISDEGQSLAMSPMGLQWTF